MAIADLDIEMSPAERRQLVEGGVVCNGDKPLALMRRDPNYLLLRNAYIDTARIRKGGAAPEIPQAYRASKDTKRFIVQFADPLNAAHRDALKDLGIALEHYVPNRAFAVTADPDALDRLRRMGGVAYIEPFHPYFKMSPDIQTLLLGSPSAEARERAEIGSYEMLLFSGDDAVEALRAMKLEPSIRDSHGVKVATVSCDPSKLNELVHIDGVKWVEPRVPRTMLNDVAADTLRATAVRFVRTELDGSGVVVGSADSGVDQSHPAFTRDPTQPVGTNNTRIIHYEYAVSSSSDGLPGDSVGHGTHVVGSILGNGALSDTVELSPGSGSPPYGPLRFEGMAPQAELVMLKDFNAWSDPEVARKLYLAGARICNHSWGASVAGYTIACRDWDAAVRDADPDAAGDQQLITFFAAGNSGGGTPDGQGGVAGTVGSPGSAKNVITIGAVEQRRRATNLPLWQSMAMSDTGWQIASFSSRGPTPDGRQKPEVVAPGVYILSVQSKDYDADNAEFFPQTEGWDYEHGNVKTGPNYALMSGTSMATPLSCGIGTLLYQHFQNVRGEAPTPSMLKAMLIAGAVRLDSVFYEPNMAVEAAFFSMNPYFHYLPAPQLPPIVYQGFGMIDLERTVEGAMVRDSDDLIYQNEEDAVATDEYKELGIDIDGTEEGGLKIVLTWTDWPGTPGVGAPLVNDLDLIVLDPAGNMFVGNLLKRRVWGEASIPIRPAVITEVDVIGDGFNTTEVVILRDLVPGQYRVIIHGFAVPVGPQDYSLAVVKGQSTLGDSGGTMPALAVTADGRPVLATANAGFVLGDPLDPLFLPGGADVEANVVGVRLWEGSFGTEGDIGAWRHLRTKWFDYGSDAFSEMVSGVVNGAALKEPALAVAEDGNIYVAFTYNSEDSAYPDCIFLRYWNGTRWGSLGGSFANHGICDADIQYDAFSPSVAIGADGRPIVAYVQPVLTWPGPVFTQEIVVKRWNGSSWVTFDGTPHGYAAPGLFASSVDMVVDDLGFPVLATRDPLHGLRVKVLRWTGAAWAQVGSDLGNITEASRPRVVVDGAEAYVTWVEYPTGLDEWQQTIRVARSVNYGAWAGIAGSMAYPGVSGSTAPAFDPGTGDVNLHPPSLNPQLGVMRGRAFVAWQWGNTNDNRVLVRRLETNVWSWAGNSDSNGVVHLNGVSKLYSMAVTVDRRPVLAIESDRYGALSTVVIGLAGDPNAPPPGVPQFAGLQTAVGQLGDSVDLGWDKVSWPDEIITYHIYRSSVPANGWEPGTEPAPTNPATIADVFANRVGSVAEQDAFTVTGLAPNRVWYFGVRAENSYGEEQNTVIIAAGPFDLLGDADRDWLTAAEEVQVVGTLPSDPDTDGDGMWDGWEWFYSTNNTGQVGGIPAHTATQAMDAVGVPDGTEPYGDLDNDGLLNFEEFEFWLANLWVPDYTTIDRTSATNWWPDPTNPDSDGDGLPDGWEGLNGLDPTDPGDAGGDLDGDGLVNSNEYEWGTDPDTPDSDYDGVWDGTEVYIDGTLPMNPDSDEDGLSDGLEKQLGSNPMDQDTNDNDLTDGDEYELGYTDLSHTNPLVVFMEATDGSGPIIETFELPAYTNWMTSFDKGLWHRTLTDPDPASDHVMTVGTNTYFIEPAFAHSTNHAARFALDAEDGTNILATYDLDGEFAVGQIVSPAFDPVDKQAINLYVSWNEYYETEKDWDICVLSVSLDGGVTWTVELESEYRSGRTEGWQHRVADLTEFVANTNVALRFQFKTKNAINNEFRGWWIDDIKIFAAARIQGTVRDINGKPVVGATIMALGRGGVTNVVYGHHVVPPGNVFKRAVTDGKGQYRLEGLCQGQYYVKATAPGFRSEFWNGPLYPTDQYYEAFGLGINFGVRNKTQVSPLGIKHLTNQVSWTYAHFELEPGQNGGRLGVVYDEPRSVYFGHAAALQALVWNGQTNAPGLPGDHTVPYTTTNLLGGVTEPDYETNPVAPATIDDVVPGTHRVWFYPGWTNMPWIPTIPLEIRDGEITAFLVATNQAPTEISVRCSMPGQRIFVDGRDSGRATLSDDAPVYLEVLQGPHEVQLISTGTTYWIPPQIVTALASRRAEASFDLSEVWASGGLPQAAGSVEISTVDLFGDPLTGAEVFFNGWQLTADQTASGQLTTPLTIPRVLEGTHYFTLRKDGYRQPQRYSVVVYSDGTSKVSVPLPESDLDYDRVGDGLEIEGYTNIYMYSASDDPDADGLDNLTEFDIFRLYKARLKINHPDTDGDDLSDGYEVNYDGNLSLYGLTSLQKPVPLDAADITVFFSGRFLRGVSALPTLVPPGGIRLSIEGDAVKANAVVWDADLNGTPILTYAIEQGQVVHDQVLNNSHIPGDMVFSDPYPHKTDSDEDGMWDGFEVMFSERSGEVAWSNKLSTLRPAVPFGDVGLDPLDNYLADDDPDNDGVENLDEFLGMDNLNTAHSPTNDSTRPDLSDSDGDLMPDGWERNYLLDPTDPSDASEDPDNDGLTNLEEWLARTNPQEEDTDNDMVIDGDEVHKYGTDPTIMDSDLDGLLDGQEVVSTMLDPELLDGGFFPLWDGGDMDRDGLVDGPTDWDTDGDGMPDGFEVVDAWGHVRPEGMRLDPSNPFDGPLDYDGDGLTNYEEWLIRDNRVGNPPHYFQYGGAVWYVWGAVDGVLVMEAENTVVSPDTFEWSFETNAPPAGFTGTGFLVHTNDDWLTPPAGWDTNENLYYIFDIDVPGGYLMQIRSANVGVPAYSNGVWVDVDGGGWRYTFSDHMTNEWRYDTFQCYPTNATLTNGCEQITNRYAANAAFYVFNEGAHIMSVRGGANGFAYDRIHFYRLGTSPVPDENTSANAAVDTADPLGLGQALWDYPTDPFNPDSDGDEMPDGWEAFSGLHPVDPIRNIISGEMDIVRAADYWRYGDPDQDGVRNIAEFKYRFLLDPDAAPYALTGSLHPWFDDTDEEALYDGEEVYSMRSNGLEQDTDGDGLLDGQGLKGRAGEVETPVGAEGAEHFDRSMNDIWTLIPLLGGGWAWGMVQPDRDVLYAHLFDEAGSHYVAIENEILPFIPTNQPPTDGIMVVPPVWALGSDGPIDYVTYIGGYRDDEAGPDAMDNLLNYRFTITDSGLYYFTMHSYATYGPLLDDPYYGNSVWIKIDTRSWKKVVSDNTQVGVWQTRTRFMLQVTGGEIEVLPLVPLQPGVHSVQISGRAPGFRLDRFALHKSDFEPADVPGLALSPLNPFSPVPLGPTRRWGGHGALVGYEVQDDPLGTYAGGLVSDRAPKEQHLLAAAGLVAIGGRSGPQIFNEIWELKDESIWYLREVGVLWGQVELVAAPPLWAGTGNGHPDTVVRPRPGASPLYKYYDGIRDNDPLAIWGEAGAVNYNRVFFLTGWDVQGVGYWRYGYVPYIAGDKGINNHDAVEDYGWPLLLYIDEWYEVGDNSPEILYAWDSKSDAFQRNEQDGARDYELYQGVPTVQIGQVGPTTNETRIAGFNIRNVLTTAADFTFAGNDMAGLVATLDIVTMTAITNAFDVLIFAELQYDFSGVTVPNGLEHPTLTSPPDYFSDSDLRPNMRWKRPPEHDTWTTNSEHVVVTVPETEIFTTISIDVTEAVKQCFGASVGTGLAAARWELGNNIGFVIVGQTNSIGMARIIEHSAILRLTSTTPPWYNPGGYATLVPPPLIIMPYQRKSGTMDILGDQLVIFGGVDGNRVLNDTWVSSTAPGDDWIQIYPPTRPPARWGHSMVQGFDGLVIFGGFDKDNEPLNDLWTFNGANWREIFPDPLMGKPAPRGGASLAPGLFLFGGTDGEKYFDDTWVWAGAGSLGINRPQPPGGWSQVEPGFEFATAPAGRAYALTYPGGFGGVLTVFGGRTGTLPTGRDTDQDWIPDGIEVDLGGPASGRDPLANARSPSASLNISGGEEFPYVFHGAWNPSPLPPRIQWVDMFERADYLFWRPAYETLYPHVLGLWWHRFVGEGVPEDPRDEWEHGVPVGGGEGIAEIPARAYSGRYCWGTDLGGNYPDDTTMELYSPLTTLQVPWNDPGNTNDWFLVFHEWLDLADENDYVKIEVVRPESPADILTRVSGPNRPILTILGDRNNAANTEGAWRRVIVPLVLKEDNIFLRWVLHSDEEGNGGGWYIDDVAFVQAGEIAGLYGGVGNVYLYGIDGTNVLQFAQPENNRYLFLTLMEGGLPLPTGDYRLWTDGGSSDTASLHWGSPWEVLVPDLTVKSFHLDIHRGVKAGSGAGVMSVTWNAEDGGVYEVYVCSPEDLSNPNPWQYRATVRAGSFVDHEAAEVEGRFYRVVRVQ